MYGPTLKSSAPTPHERRFLVSGPVRAQEIGLGKPQPGVLLIEILNGRSSNDRGPLRLVTLARHVAVAQMPGQTIELERLRPADTRLRFTGAGGTATARALA
ncbi:MAG TPA: hypothetical protein VFZ66_09290 [Herpetosiphonaceae bacterium]